jgi:hypothetical protein
MAKNCLRLFFNRILSMGSGSEEESSMKARVCMKASDVPVGPIFTITNLKGQDILISDGEGGTRPWESGTEELFFRMALPSSVAKLPGTGLPEGYVCADRMDSLSVTGYRWFSKLGESTGVFIPVDALCELSKLSEGQAMDPT